MRTHVQFRSTQFPPYPGEEEEINPGIWGKRLAEYLRENLKATAIETGGIVAEDWGYMLPLPNRPFPMWIGCGCHADSDDSFLVFIEPSKPYIRRWIVQKIDTTDEVEKIASALDRILNADPLIRDAFWWKDA